MKIGYYVTPLKKHQQFELDFGNFGTIALTREAVIELVENLKAALEEHPAAQPLRVPDVCPVCAGKGTVTNTHGVEQFCLPCDGTGQRR